jgi:hypothetical protein
MANVNLTERDIDYISRVVATEVPASLQRTAPDQYKAMVEAVVDTITNRVASTGFPNTVEGVVNQNRQFSKIAGPQNLDPYGKVSNAPKAPASLQKMVETHVTQRANGKPSTIGNSVNYANPNYSTPNNLGWITDMADAGGVTLGVGDAIHIHGNAPGAKVPDDYTISAPGAIGNPSQMDSKNIGYSPSKNPGTERMQPGYVQDRTFRNTDGSVFALPTPRSTGVMTPVRAGIPTPAPRQVSAAPTSDFRAPPPPLTITPNKVNTFTFSPPRQAPTLNPAAIQQMRDNLTSRMAFALPNPSNMNISGYGFSTPAKPAGPSATGTATGSINRASAVGNAAVPARTGGVLGGRGNINPPNVVAAPANVLSSFDQFGRFTGNQQSSKAPTSDFRSTLAERAAVPQAPTAQRGPTVSTWGAMANAPAVQAPSRQAALGPTNDPSVRAAQADLAKSNRRDQFARDLINSMPAPATTDAAKLASQYGQYQRGTVPSAQINPSVFDMIDVPQSRSLAAQYASYGAGKVAPQVAASATQSVPGRSVAPQTVGPRSPTVNAPSVAAPMTEKQRIDKAIADMKVGIPPADIYDQNAPGQSGFRGFGAGGFLGNLLTGNIGNMQGLPSRGIGGFLGALLGGAVAGVPGALAGAALGNRAPGVADALGGLGSASGGNVSGGPSGGNQGNFGMGGFGFGGGGGFNSVGGGMGYGSGSAFGGGYN